MFEHITANEVAGYCVGALLLGATIAAPKIDYIIAASQRSSVGMCKRCGDLRLIACSKCKGTGSSIRGDSFSFNPVDGVYQSFRAQSKGLSISCNKCQARGHFCCPACSQVPQI